ncbi:MAG: GNAT family protein [Hyphomicrobiales bacterium]
MSVWPETFSLSGQHVDVVPLERHHLDDLKEAVRDGELHRLWYTMIPHADDMEAEIERRLGLRETGWMQPFSIIDKASGKVVGQTTYMNIDAVNRRVEIGMTWYRKSVQRTPLNTECKLLLLTHAFEALDCIAVEFRTHVVNESSRRAIERLGAKFDGIIRAHMVMANGTIRDTAVYSIIAPEWPTVKAHLGHKLQA